MFVSTLCKTIIKSFEEHPEDWELSQYKLTHTRSNFQLWIGNGSLFLDGYGIYRNCIGLVERHILWFYVSRLKKNQILKMMWDKL